MSADRIQTTLQAYFAAINGDDFDALAALFAPEAGVRSPFDDEPHRGRDAIRAYYEAILHGWAEHHDQPTRTVVCGTTATVEISFTGVREGGQDVAFDAVDVFDFDAEGRIAALRTWFDSHRLVARTQHA